MGIFNPGPDDVEPWKPPKYDIWADKRPTQVYRLYNAADELLYVGMSTSWPSRMLTHAAKPWFKDVVRVAIVVHKGRGKAKEAESKAIREEHPRFNIAEVPKERRAAV